MALGFNKAFTILSLVFSVFLLVTFTGCAKKAITTGDAEKAIPTEEVASAAKAATGEEGARVAGLEESLLEGRQGKMDQHGAQISEGRTSAPLLPIYFDFDRYNIRGDMVSRMEHNARYLLQHPGVKIQIQGNCDERGTNEYNIALGEKRAKSAKDFLINMGVDPSRIDTVSFGEERPLDPGHNEDAWAKNRRDDFVILK